MTIKTAIQSHLSDALIEMQHPELQDKENNMLLLLNDNLST